MPLFRIKNPMPHLEDATFDFPVNPDEEAYVEVVEAAPKPAKAATVAADESKE
jgi:hypothetical protein